MKWLQLAIAIVLATICSAVSLGCEYVAHIEEQNIQSINLMELPGENIVHTCTRAEIREFANAYNDAVADRNDIGTTPEVAVEISFTDGTTMTVWGNSAGVVAVERDGRQFNIKGTLLDDWLTSVLIEN